MTKNEKDKLLIQKCLDERWYPIMLGKKAFLDTECDLCLTYGDCTGCPIALSTGESSCQGTPYDAFMRATAYDKYKPTKLPQAQPMIDFLEKLRDSL